MMSNFNIHIQLNQKMRTLFNEISFLDLGFLNKGLEKLIINGFVKKHEDCIILKESVKKRKVTLSDFTDKTGYECFMNKINLEDYLLSSDEKVSIFIQQGLLTLLTLMKLIKEFDNSKPNVFNFIFSINQEDKNISLHSYILRFYKLREGEAWLEKNLNSYQEALMIFSFVNNDTNKNIDVSDLKNLILSEIQKKIGKQ